MVENKICKIGLTGGIGTGKTTVAKIFESFGIPVLNADLIAKQLMQNDPVIKQQLIAAFGQEIYKTNILQNNILANKVFNDQELLTQLNKIVHPATIQYANEWIKKQTTAYAIKEAAILVETQSYKDLDFLIGVKAPYEMRIARTLERDLVSRDAIIARMDKQMDNDIKMSYCKYVIENDGAHSLIEQCLAIHQDILQNIK